ncbi:MAG: glycosyltransferase [Candidatus Altiarchaeota archaeon]|nr:glycosyltransferase [Candidatus Altiarchaeota archaeon]
MKVTVVIPTLNEEAYIGKCLEGIKAQTVRPEIIVVDSGSSDKTLEIAGKYADKVLSGGLKNIGFNRQRGAEAASGEIVITTDADCVHKKDWVERILRRFEDSRIVAVSGPTIPMTGEAVLLDKLCYFTGNVIVWVIHWLGVVWFRGSNAAYRKDALIRSGGYNTEMAAREDSDLSQRVAKLGKTVFDPSIIVMTSMRRRRAMGWLKTLRYYVDTPIALITKKAYYKKV